MIIKIIGAGPAGLIAGLYLNKAGYKPIIYEKQKRREYTSTLCGEGISLERLEELRRDTGFNSNSYISKKVKGIKLVFPNKKEFLAYKDGAVLDRTRWLKGMIERLEKNGVEIKFGNEIKNINNLKYDYLIGAEGPNSYLRNKIGGEIEVRVGSQYKMKLDREAEFLEFYLDEMFYEKKRGVYGYGWVFPKKDLVNVGVGGKFETLDKFLEKYDIKGEILERDSYPLGINGTKFSNSKKDILLTGGAGGLTNALMKGGLSPIIKCSKFLVEHVKGNKDYEESIRSSCIDPEFWKNKIEEFYTSNEVYKTIGNLLDGSVKGNIPLKLRLKILIHLRTFFYLKRFNKLLSKLSKASW